MRIIHLSDLHFGTETSEVMSGLLVALKETSPDLVVISGDFTQVASSSEFKAAKAFIESFSVPVFCVPGNHDIPRYDLWERFVHPYRKYKEYIDHRLCPVFDNDEVVIAGLNSARRILPHWNWANGAISQEQLQSLKEVYEERDPERKKRRLCVFHHPIHQALNQPMDTVVFGAKNALNALNSLGVDLVMTGHVHHASVTTLGDIDHKTIYLSASTALSSRTRTQEQGFNVIDLSAEALEIHIHSYNGKGFSLHETYKQANTSATL